MASFHLIGDLVDNGPVQSLTLSIIVPTLNEAENLPLLVPRIAAALAPSQREYEILIVDDNSRDDTAAVCAKLAETYPLRLLTRHKPDNGLSGAVLHGMSHACGEVFLCMDADLQHPPESIEALLEPLESGRADFTIGSRYQSGGSTEEQWGRFRRLNSQVATLLARPFSGPVKDPMSGFFALRRQTYQQARRLTPLGYKIALELMCKCRVRQVVEIPIHFGMRQKGESKLSISQQFRYLEHLSRLYDFTFPRASPMLKFVIATGTAWLWGAGMYWLAARRGLSGVGAIMLSYAVAILVTAIFHLRYVRTQREFLSTRHPWIDFGVIAVAEWTVAALTALWIAARVNDPGMWETFGLCFGAATLGRYMLRKEFLLDIRGLRREPEDR